jgi:competence protein ComGC
MSALKFSASAARARHGQRGQALVFVTVTILIMVIAVFMTYNVGQLTNQKTRLQNTADAAAYSAALAQARDYNFSAYMNRAMIANDVSVAQQLALRSWVRAFDEAFKNGGLLSKYAPPRRLDPAKGPLYGIWDFAENKARTAAYLLNGALDTFTPLFVVAVYNVNNILALSQKVYHYSTSVTVAQTTGWIEGLGDKLGALTGLSFLGDISSKFNEALSLGVDSNVVLKNDPNAQLSELGLLAFVYDTKQWLTFTENRNPVGPWGIDYQNTMEKIVTLPAGYYYKLSGYCFPRDRVGNFCKCYAKAPGICVWYAERSYLAPANYQKNYTVAPLKDSTPDNIFKEYDGVRKDRYANIVVDMLDEFTTDRNAAWKFPVGVPYVGFIDALAIAGGWTPIVPPNVWTYKNVTHESEGLKLWNDEKHSTPAGANQGYKMHGSWNRRWKTSDTVDLEGMGSTIVALPPPLPPWSFRSPWPLFGDLPGPNKLPPGGGSYASASSKLSTGDATGSTKYTPSNKFGEHVSNNDIFRKYRDVTNIEQGTATANQNWTSPPLLIEVERSTRTIWTSDQSLKASAFSTTKGCTREASVPGKRVEAVFGEGNFQLGDGSSSNCMRAMAKAEAYFSRPSDLFARADNKTEYGSLYSPYWQARLVKTTPTDQALSMAFHYCDGKGNVLACVGAMMDSAKQETKSLWNTLTNLRSYLN